MTSENWFFFLFPLQGMKLQHIKYSFTRILAKELLSAANIIVLYEMGVPSCS